MAPLFTETSGCRNRRFHVEVRQPVRRDLIVHASVQRPAEAVLDVHLGHRRVPASAFPVEHRVVHARADIGADA
jgi:hypothetical protein